MFDFDPKKDYYKILGVGEDASADDIKKAFKKLAVKHHPDRGGDKAKFQEANEAHQILSDENKRRQYDSVRKGGFGGGDGGFGGFGGFGGQGGDFEFDIGDLLGGMFGGGFGGAGGGRRVSTRGADVKISIDISFEEGYLGVEKKVSYNKMVVVPGAISDKCSACNGKGSTVQQTRTPFGIMQNQVVCNHCGGTGSVFKKDGKELGEGGFEKKKEVIDVKIPAGIKDGVYLKYHGRGNAGISGESGDLYIKINVIASRYFERKGDDLHVKSDVTLFDLVLGGEIEINHPEGKLKIKVPKGTQIGDMIKVSGKGYGERGVFAKRGDMYIVPKISVPKRLSKEQEKLWEELKNVSK